MLGGLEIFKHLRKSYFELDLSKNTKLKVLSCFECNLSVLDVSECTELTKLDYQSNSIRVLDLSKSTKLTDLNCQSNNLTALDASTNTKLAAVYCGSNNLSIEALNALFVSLHSNTVENKRISIQSNPGRNGCDTRIATRKGWVII